MSDIYHWLTGLKQTDKKKGISEQANQTKTTLCFISLGQINIYYSFLQLKFNTFLLTASVAAKRSQMTNFVLFQVFTLRAFSLMWQVSMQNL